MCKDNPEKLMKWTVHEQEMKFYYFNTLRFGFTIINDILIYLDISKLSKFISKAKHMKICNLKRQHKQQNFTKKKKTAVEYSL